MKILILFLTLINTLLADECKVRNSSMLVNQRIVGPVTNLIKNTDEEGNCAVSFDITVDGKSYSLTDRVS